MQVRAKIKHNDDEEVVNQTAALFGSVQVTGEHAVVIIDAAHELTEEQQTHLDTHEHELELVRSEAQK